VTGAKTGTTGEEGLRAASLAVLPPTPTELTNSGDEGGEVNVDVFSFAVSELAVDA